MGAFLTFFGIGIIGVMFGGCGLLVIPHIVRTVKWTKLLFSAIIQAAVTIPLLFYFKHFVTSTGSDYPFESLVDNSLSVIQNTVLGFILILLFLALIAFIYQRLLRGQMQPQLKEEPPSERKES
ncbi:MAG: hypothetical protein K0S22_1750 [Oscillospiraceae bacterium]|jgi:membrane-anchored glycerophosphoryl diester phosphodiesterase (GDPDase)|nr:hypothetical protein [Oscillospiraceae bacterium]